MDLADGQDLVVGDGVPGAKKKGVEGDLLGLATTGKVRANGMAAAIVRCREVNRMLGTQLGPWELEELPEEWLTAVEMWIDDLPKVKQWQAESQAALARVRNRRKVQ